MADRQESGREAVTHIRRSITTQCGRAISDVQIALASDATCRTCIRRDENQRRYNERQGHRA